MKSNSLLVPLLLGISLSGLPLPADAQILSEISPCSEEGTTNCAVTDEACAIFQDVETCYACLRGYVKFNETCTSIEDTLSFEAYLDAFEPIFVNPDIDNATRLEILKGVAIFISESNLDDKPYTLGLNAYSAESTEETAVRNGVKFNDDEDTAPVATLSSSEEEEDDGDDLPAVVDWVSAGKVSIVKNQVICGCCWSVAAAGAAESKYAIDNDLNIQNDNSLNLSFQQMISCSTSNSGCNGGNAVRALNYAHDTNFGGLASYIDYPYQDRLGETSDTCELDDIEPEYHPPEPRMVTERKKNSSFEERLQRMKQGLKEQPVSVVMKASCTLIQSYHSGVLTDDGDCACDESDCLDHAVLAVGYNDNHDPPYLVLKNSWGQSYGENGYFKIAQTPKGEYGLFGILAEGVFPSTDEDFEEADDPQVWKWILVAIAIAVGIAIIWWGVQKFVCAKRRQAAAEASEGPIQDSVNP